MEEPRHVLRELNMICFREGWTLVVVYSVSGRKKWITDGKYMIVSSPLINAPNFKTNKNHKSRYYRKSESTLKFFGEKQILHKITFLGHLAYLLDFSKSHDKILILNVIRESQKPSGP